MTMLNSTVEWNNVYIFWENGEMFIESQRLKYSKNLPANGFVNWNANQIYSS